MQLICVDEQNFGQLRARNGIYVDKTKAMYDLFKDGKYFFIARPRRFGKSLLCSTLAELFAGNRRLFTNTWIDGSDWEWKKHPVLHLDMTSAAGEDITIAEMRIALQDMLLDNAHQCGIELKIERPAAMLEKLLKAAYEKYGIGVALIIDEYDKPMLDTIDRPTINKHIHAALRSFYGPLKKSTIYLKFVFITGVFKFTKTSLFSNFNNLKDITFSPKAADVVGYTEQEVRTFFAEHLEALAIKHKISVEEMMSSLRNKYNGYNFGVDIAINQLFGSVYNSYALNYVFAEQQQLEKWFESGSPHMLIKKLASNQFKDIQPKKLIIKFTTLDRSCTPEDLNSTADEYDETVSSKHISSLSMLYYAGYMTMKKYENNKISLDFPNLDVASSFSETLLPLLLQKNVDTVNEIMDGIHDVFIDQRLDDLKELLNDALAPVSYHTLKKPSTKSKTAIPQENLYHIGFYYLFIGSRVKTTIEDGTIRGRIDISVETAEVVYLLELKMDESAESAIQQIKERDYARKFKHTGKKIYAVGVSISSKKRTVNDLVWEQL